MAKNDPTDTGGLFVGRRPGTGPVRYRGRPAVGTPARQRFDRALAFFLLAIETLVLVSLWGPQPLGWLWVGSQIDYQTGSVSFGILCAFIGLLFTLMLTLWVAKQIDHAWKLVRRASGHEQKDGAINTIFVISAGLAVSVFLFWFLVIEGPGSSSFSPRA